MDIKSMYLNANLDEEIFIANLQALLCLGKKYMYVGSSRCFTVCSKLGSNGTSELLKPLPNSNSLCVVLSITLFYFILSYGGKPINTGPWQVWG